MVLAIKKEIYIKLLNEDVFVMRPTLEEKMGKDNIYKVLPTPNYDPEDEEWEFPPGSIVMCETEIREGKNI